MRASLEFGLCTAGRKRTRRLEVERKRSEQLVEEVAAWRRASEIRAYVVAVKLAAAGRQEIFNRLLDRC